MSNIDDPRLDAIIDAHLRHLEGDGPAPDLADLPDELRDEARARLAVLEAAWGAQIEPPDDDPVARRFGFDRAGQRITIDGRRIATLRKAAQLDLTELHTLITNAGGAIAPGDLFRVEQNAAVELDQATVSAIVAALRTSVPSIEATETIDFDAVRAFVDSPDFYDLIDTWAAEQGRDAEQVRPRVTEQVFAAQYRADDVTTAQLIEIVRAILQTLEQ